MEEANRYDSNTFVEIIIAGGVNNVIILRISLYGDVPSILSQVTYQRMCMLGGAFQSAKICSQPLVVVLTCMLTWMLGERQITSSVSAA